MTTPLPPELERAPHQCECCNLWRCHGKKPGIGYYCELCFELHYGPWQDFANGRLMLETQGRNSRGETYMQFNAREREEHAAWAKEDAERDAIIEAFDGIAAYAVLINDKYKPLERSARIPCKVLVLSDGGYALAEPVALEVNVPPSTHVTVIRDTGDDHITTADVLMSAPARFVGVGDIVRVGAKQEETDAPTQP